MSEYLQAVFVGGLIGITGGLVVEFFRTWQEGKRRKEERRIEKEKTTIEYFRNIYNAFAPFLALHSQFNHILGASIVLKEEPPREQEQSDKIIALLPKFLKDYQNFLDKGYAALIPEDLSKKIIYYGTKIAFLSMELKKKPKVENWDAKIHTLIPQILVTGKQIRSRIRELLNVESFD